MKRYFYLIFTALCLMSFLPKKKVPKNVQSYITLHKAYALELKDKYNIPASVTLAQGMIESGYGSSNLAKNHMNFFGIMDFKEDYWDDKCTYKSPNGKTWRHYASLNEAYQDRADFLKKTCFWDGRKAYAHLFELQRTDYKGWAKGLQDAGYAGREKGYAKMLIKLIEKYNLQSLD